MRTIEEAKRDLLLVIQHLRFAVEEAQKIGTPRLGILSVKEDGSGRIECKLDCAFIEDVALLIGAPELSEEDRTACRAKGLMDKLGLRS